MWRLVLGQIVRRRGRSLAVVAAIVVAAVSFSLLTSAVASSRLQVKGTVNNNFRSAYDILVRPTGATAGLERSDNLVRENFLSGIFGGISMTQYHRIQTIPGVQVAAPVAMVGYALPQVELNQFITKRARANPATQQLYRMRQIWTADRGLSHYPGAGSGAETFNYVTRAPILHRDGYSLTMRDPITGRVISPCTSFHNRHQPGRSAFDRNGSVGALCNSTRPQPRNYQLFPGNKIGTGFAYPFPLLIAAIDPIQEAKLVGLDTAVTSGRYLRPDEGGSLACHRSNCVHQVPVLMADRPVVDESLKIAWQQLQVPNPEQIPGRLAGTGAESWLRSLPGKTVKTHTYRSSAMYRRLLREYRRPLNAQNSQYWSASPVKYRRAADGHLTPVPVTNPPETWTQTAYTDDPFFAPAAAADVGFRRLHVHLGSHGLNGGTAVAPALHSVGTFNPRKLQGFSQLSQVPLTTYYAPTADPGDPHTRELLRGRPLLPNGNLAGYLQQPPMMLTTLKGLRLLRNTNAFIDEDSVQGPPISAIRIRVAGVTGADKNSQERVRLVAEQIKRQTGLDVDITIGSSPTSELVDLPAGRYGRPELTLKEGWVKKGVAVELLSAIDTKSLALFGLVLVVCALFLLNAVTAAVRTRAEELGILSCLGWPRRKIFWLLETELILTGLVAGIVGSAIAIALVAAFSLHVAWVQLALITPVAVLLAALAGIAPTHKASGAVPMQAVQPAVRTPRRAREVGSVFALGLVGVRRTPGRSALAAASLFIGVAALAALIAIQSEFAAHAVGSLLGNVVAIDVRGVDLLAAVLILALGAFTIADVAYLNITERRAEIGTLRATGWAAHHLRRLFATEALTIAVLGAVSGAVVGVAVVGFLLHTDILLLARAAAIATGGGVLAALLALVVPLSRLGKLAPAQMLNH